MTKRATRKQILKVLETLIDIVERQCFTGHSHYHFELPKATREARGIVDGEKNALPLRLETGETK